MTHKSSHLVNALGSVLVPLSALLVAPLLSRGLGPAERGEFAADQALILICSALVGLGVSDAASSAWLRWESKTRWLVSSAATFFAAVSALIGTLTTGADSDRSWLIVIGSVFFFIALQARAVGLAHSDILGVGLEKVATSLSRVVFTLALFWASMLTVETALIALVLPQIMGALLIFLRVRVRPAPTKIDEGQVASLHFRGLVVGVLSGLGGVLIVNLDSVYLLGVIGAEELGYYAIAVLVAEIFTAAAKPFRDAVFDGRLPSRSAVIPVLRRSGLFMLLGIIAGAACIPWGVPLIFGQEFQPAVSACMVMLFGGAAKGMSYVVNGVLVRREELITRTLGTWIGLAVSIIIIIPLAGIGAMGASLAKSAGYAVMLSIGWIGVRRIDPSA